MMIQKAGRKKTTVDGQVKKEWESCQQHNYTASIYMAAHIVLAFHSSKHNPSPQALKL